MKLSYCSYDFSECCCVAPLVFRAPACLDVGPGCFVCPWAAARPRAVRATSFARRVVSKPGQAPPPPTDTAARPTTIPQHSHPAPHPSFPSPRPISHVIPLRLLQVLNSDRWNCNVFRLRYNFSQSNYVRLFWRVGPDARHGALASSTQSTATTITSNEPPRKKYRPSRAPHRLAHVLSERKIAPARQKLAKIATFERAGAKNFFTAPHSTSRRGGFSFTPAPPLPHKRDKIRPARLHQRPGGTKFAQHAQNRPKSAVFRQQGEFCLGLTQNPDLLGEFYLAHEHPRFHPRRTLRPQPKPRAARAETTTPVAHWPHD